MKYKVGDRVQIKSIDWYNENKDADGIIDCGVLEFDEELSAFCGKIVTLNSLSSTNAYDRDCYTIIEDNRRYNWTDEMIEGLVDITQDRVDKLACKIDEELPSGNPYEWECPEGYQFVDENGNVINTQKIVLEKKKKEYPKIYEECCEILGGVTAACWSGYKCGVLGSLNKLLICRDAYWKIAGEEMGLEKPWEPDSDTEIYNIYRFRDKIYISCSYCVGNCNILEFPTEEMRDAFYENFKKEIEICKEFL